MKFKVGDKVRLKDVDSPYVDGFFVGDICEISDLNCGETFAIQINKNDWIGYVNENELELIEKNNNRLTKYEIDEEDLDKEKLDDKIKKLKERFEGTATEYRVEYAGPSWGYYTTTDTLTTIPF